MRLLAILGGALAILALVVVAVGYALPVRHQAARERAYPVPADALFATITAVAEYPSWRGGVERVELLDPVAGRTRYREVASDGSITYVVEEMEPGRRLVTRIADDSLPFGGRWTYELTPAAGGTSLRITEDGEVYSPIYRFVSRFVIGHHRTLDRYLADLQRRVSPGAT